jgi:glycolate oxidase iron-sulfur subunit
MRRTIKPMSGQGAQAALGYRPMQTSFTPTQLTDPAFASSNQVLRTCVHCGFCTATCPTFVLLGDELDSPRGRIYLIKDMLEGGQPATEAVVRHVDRCLSCLSCMTTCPSGVNYMHLVDHARAYIEDTYQRPWHDRALRAVLARVLPRPGVFRLAMRLAAVARPLKALVPGRSMPAQRLRAMLTLAPATLPPAGDSGRPQVHPAQGVRRGRVALLTGCAQTVLAPAINEATIRLLTRMGIEVVVAPGVGCCGALTHHMGQHEAAMAAARAAIGGWHREIQGDGLDAIVINTSGCGTTIKDYGFMFRAEPEAWRRKAEAVSALALDITEYVDRIGYVPTRPPPGLRVAYHAACSLQHGQRVTAAPKALLRAAGFTVVEPRDAHLCCGSAGTYNILQPEIAGRLRARKLETIEAVQPDLIAAGNVGCLTQLAGGIPTIHTVALLDWMAGGPAPADLPRKIPA